MPQERVERVTRRMGDAKGQAGGNRFRAVIDVKGGVQPGKGESKSQKENKRRSPSVERVVFHRGGNILANRRPCELE